jgi:hypothetical protein
LIEATNLVSGRVRQHRLITERRIQEEAKDMALAGSIERKMFENLAHNLHLRQTIIILAHGLANR